MPSSFVFTFFAGNSSISAIAVPDTNYEPILYHIKVSDLTFRILPSEAPDGSILWVDEYGDAMPLFQCAGKGIEQYELTHGTS